MKLAHRPYVLFSNTKSAIQNSKLVFQDSIEDLDVSDYYNICKYILTLPSVQSVYHVGYGMGELLLNLNKLNQLRIPKGFTKMKVGGSEFDHIHESYSNVCFGLESFIDIERTTKTIDDYYFTEQHDVVIVNEVLDYFGDPYTLLECVLANSSKLILQKAHQKYKDFLFEEHGCTEMHLSDTVSVFTVDII